MFFFKHFGFGALHGDFFGIPFFLCEIGGAKFYETVKPDCDFLLMWLLIAYKDQFI